MEFFYALMAVLATNIGTGWVVFAYTRKAMEAAHKVELKEEAPKKRAYNRKAKVVAATMTPATGMTESGKAYLNGHASHSIE